MAAWQLGVFLDDAAGYGISPRDGASLQVLADLIRWHSDEYRRFAAKTRADAEMVDAYFDGRVIAPNTAAAFEASISRPGHPPFPKRSETVNFMLLQPVRDVLEEAHAILSQGSGLSMACAAKQAAALYSWCHPPLSV
ncbi:hypothetical protein ABQE45_23960 [Mycobacteroides chelonae]